MAFSASLRQRLVAKLAEAREKYPAALSDDGKALLVDVGIGYGAFVSPDGDIFMETYDLADSSPPTVDRSTHAQAIVVGLGARRILELAELMPSRPQGARDCLACAGEGWKRFGPDFRFICQACAGLGWREAPMNEEP